MILAYLAKYAEKYGVLLYAFTIVGNHYHMVARFPEGNRSAFFRDLNARVAQAVKYCVPNYLGGPLFERRFTPQILPLDEDVQNYFFYCALQSVNSGLCKKISDYQDYNSFNDAASNRTRTFKLFSYGNYNAAKRNNPNLNIKDFEEEHTLQFERLPGFENASSKQYKVEMHNLLEQRRLEIVKDRIARKKGFLGKDNLKKVIPGSYPHSTKKGGIRPLVLSVCRKAKNEYLNWYFSIISEFKKCVEKYRNNEFDIPFPQGTFRPPGTCIRSG